MMKQIFAVLMMFAVMMGTAFAVNNITITQNVIANAAPIINTPFSVANTFGCLVNVSSTKYDVVKVFYNVSINSVLRMNGTLSWVPTNTPKVVTTFAGKSLFNWTRGDNVSCVIMAQSMVAGVENSTWNASANVTITNSVPTVSTNITLIGNAATGHSLNVSASFADLDNVSDYNASAVNTSNGGTCGIYAVTTTGTTIKNIRAQCNSSDGNITTICIKMNDTSNANASSCGSFTYPNNVPTVLMQPNFTDGASGHKFNVTFNISDADGKVDMKFPATMSVTGATCTLASTANTTTTYSPIYNCTGTLGATAYIMWNTTDNASAAVATANTSHAVPNLAPVGVSAISPGNGSINTSNVSSAVTITCINGSGATDADGDTVYYNLYYSNTSNATNSTWVPIELLRPNNCTKTWNASNLTFLSTYRLKIAATDNVTENATIAGGDFTIAGVGSDLPIALTVAGVVIVVVAAYSVSRAGKKPTS